MLLIASLPAWPQNAPADLRGVYVYTNDLPQISIPPSTQLTASFSLPGVDGIAVVIAWNAIEPAMGQYQWATLDQWIAKVMAQGKKIDLVVMAGSSTPLWLFQPAPSGAGATELSFTVSPHAGALGACDAVNIAATSRYRDSQWFFYAAWNAHHGAAQS